MLGKVRVIFCSNISLISVCVFLEALMLQPGDALLYKLRADVRGHLGWKEQALDDYRTAVELQDPRCCSGSENDQN